MTRYIAMHGDRAIELERRPAGAQARTVALAPTAGAGPSQTRVIQLLLAAIAIFAIPMASLVPTELVLPSISIAALSLAVIIAAVAWSLKAAEGKARGNVSLRDVAGVLALIGFGAGMISEPEAVVQLVVGHKS